MKTFVDLWFKDHHLIPFAKHARLNFDNGYGVSVIIGDRHIGSDGNLYEVSILKENKVCYTTPITKDVLTYKTEKQVTKIMEKVQKLPKDKPNLNINSM